VPAIEPLTVSLDGGIRQDAHRAMLPAGALYRATDVRRRASGALGPRQGLADAGLTASSASFALSGSTHGMGERSGRQVIAANMSVWERATSADQWNEVGRVARFQPLRTDLVGPIDSKSSLGQGGPLEHQWCATIGNLVALTYATLSATVWEIRTESGQLVSRTIHGTGSASSAQVYSRVIGLSGSGTAGKFVFLWYQTGTGIESISYDVASGTFGPISVVGGALFAVTDGFDASALSTSRYLLAYKSGAAVMSVKLLDGDSGVLGIQTPAIAAGAFRTNCICISGTVGEGIWVLYVQPGGARGLTFDSALAGVVRPDQAVFAEGANDFFTRPALCRLSAGSGRFYVQHSLTSPGTPPNSAFDKIYTMGLGFNLGVAPLQTFAGAQLSSTPECPDEKEARFWVDFHSSRLDGNRSALVSTSVVSGVNAPLLIELTTERVAVGNLHKPPIAHGATADWFVSSVLLRNDATLGSTVAPQLVGYVPYTASAAAGARQLIEAGGALNVCGGGIITECWGENGRAGSSFAVRLGIENGLLTPNVLGTLVSAGGTMGVGLYQYCVVFEYIDSVGRRHRSAPSAPRTATTTAGNNTVLVRFSMAEIGDRSHWQSGSLSAHIYRTQANGSTFYRITSNVTAPSAAFGFVGFQDYTDSAADSTIGDNEILYTQGGVIANQPAPAHRFAAYGDGRLWVAGTWDPTCVECSRLIVPGEPVQFTRHEAFRTYLPEPVTALGYMDGELVAFSERAIYLIQGSGPNDVGVPALPAPTRVPTDVGCIEQRSVVEVLQGLLFQSVRGIYLLPRGFGPPQLVSAGIQDDLAGATAIAAVRVHYDSAVALATGRNASMGSRSVTFLLGATALVLDEEAFQWVSVDSLGATYAAATAWGGRIALGASDVSAGLVLESDSAPAPAASIETGDIAPFGLFGKGLFREIQALTELRGDPTSITLDVNYEGQYPPQAPLLPESHVVSVPMPAGATGTRERISFPLRRQSGNSLRLKLTWQRTGSNAAGVSLMLGLGVSVEPQIGLADVAPLRRAP
jgi:hypothetical protein